MRRIVITGMGILSPVGNTTSQFFHSLMNGRSGVKVLPEDLASQLSTRIAAYLDFDPTEYFSKKEISVLDRTSQIAMAAAAQAIGDADISFGNEGGLRTGVYIGTGMGGAHAVEEAYLQLYKLGKQRVSPLAIIKVMNNAPASHISIRYGLGGPCLTFSTACSSSAVAIGEAYRNIAAGMSDIMVAGGAESLLTFGSLKCWESLGVLAEEDQEDFGASCRPFSADRTGFVMGEGAAVVVLEELEHAMKRSARVYGEIIGYGSSADAYHITGPSAEGQSRTVQLALDDASIGAAEIDYINAHGTATAANDIIETQAIKRIFGEKANTIPVSSTKSMHGHLMGAAGAAEFIVSVLAINNSAIPPTMNLRVRDPECDLDYVANTGRVGVAVRTAMTNSFAFGGTNAVLIVRRCE